MVRWCWIGGTPVGVKHFTSRAGWSVNRYARAHGTRNTKERTDRTNVSARLIPRRVAPRHERVGEVHERLHVHRRSRASDRRNYHFSFVPLEIEFPRPARRRRRGRAPARPPAGPATRGASTSTAARVARRSPPQRGRARTHYPTELALRRTPTSTNALRPRVPLNLPHRGPPRARTPPSSDETPRPCSMCTMCTYMHHVPRAHCHAPRMSLCSSALPSRMLSAYMHADAVVGATHSVSA